jgi:predicted dehydrogenase
VELIQESSETLGGTRFEGTKGWIHFVSRKLKTYPESLSTSTIGPDEIHLPRPVEYTDEGTRDYYANHVRNFLDCVRSREEPIEPVEVGHRTASLCHLGNIALQLNRTLKWDPEKERFPDDEEANQMLSRPARDKWRA